jgi:20S proteasome subunit alpha 6
MSSSFGSVGKKDENRRTLTDFKIVGLEIRELSWTWGNLPSAVSVKPEIKEEETSDNSVDTQQAATVKEEALDNDALTPAIEEVLVQSEGTLDSENAVTAREPPIVQEVFTDAVQQPSVEVNPFTPPPSRIRIYFHTPVTADDSRPIPHNSSSFSFGLTPSDSRKGKRKKLEDDDGDLEEGRTRPPPPPMGSGMSDDRSSAAASVEPSVAETASEADWLMAAIVDGEEEAEAESELHPPGGLEDDEDEEQLGTSQIMEAHEHDADADGDAETVTGAGDPAEIAEGEPILHCYALLLWCG